MVIRSQRLGSPTIANRGRYSCVSRCRAPRESPSSSTAPTTTKLQPSTRPNPATASTKTASGPLASTVPPPYSKSPSRRTGMTPGTVSMCPSRIAWFAPPPIRPTALPLSSVEASVKPNSSIRPTSQRAASSSDPVGLGIPTRSINVCGGERSGMIGFRQGPRQHFPQDMEHTLQLLVRDHEGREQAKHRQPGGKGDHAPLEHRLQGGGDLVPKLDADHQTQAADFTNGRRVDGLQLFEQVETFPRCLARQIIVRHHVQSGKGPPAP